MLHGLLRTPIRRRGKSVAEASRSTGNNSLVVARSVRGRLVVLRPDYRDCVELFAPLLQVLRAPCRDVTNGRIQLLAMAFCHLVINPFAHTSLVTARRAKILQLWRRAEVEDLLPFIILLIDE